MHENSILIEGACRDACFSKSKRCFAKNRELWEGEKNKDDSSMQVNATDPEEQILI